MPWIKKVREDWVPSENKLLKIGDKMFVTNAERLVAEGKAVYIDDEGNEVSRGEVTKCPICVYVTRDAYELADHIYQAHPKASKQPTTDVPVVTEVKGPEKKFKDMTPEEQKVWRLNNLKKARAAALAKKEAKLTSQAVKAAVEVEHAKS